MARAPKTSDSFIQTNEEYTKARTSQDSADAYREQPQRQAPGEEGADKPDFARWTDAELIDHARSLGVAEADERPDRDELVRRLNTALTRKP